MRKLIYSLFIVNCSLFISPVRAIDLSKDVADPMFIEKLGEFTSQSSMDFGNYFQFHQIASYGFSNRLSGAIDVRYRAGAENDRNGFTNIGVMGTFRAGQGNTGATDILFGFGFGGQGVVPHYSDEVYSVGLRTGRQWTAATLAMTIMTNWIFKDGEVVDINGVERIYDGGIAYIDFTPEAYLRIKGDWSLGLGATIRKVTISSLDQQWLNARFGKTFGQTGWFVNTAYEVQSQDIRAGVALNMLF